MMIVQWTLSPKHMSRGGLLSRLQSPQPVAASEGFLGGFLGGAAPTLLGRSCGFVLRFSGISQHRVERFRMAVAAMCAASASCV